MDRKKKGVDTWLKEANHCYKLYMTGNTTHAEFRVKIRNIEQGVYMDKSLSASDRNDLMRVIVGFRVAGALAESLGLERIGC